MAVEDAIQELVRILGAGAYLPSYVARRCNLLVASAAERLGETKPDFARVCNAAACVLRQAGLTNEALALHERALAIRQAVFGARHQVVSESLNNIGVLHIEMGDRERAEEFLWRAYQIRRYFRDEAERERYIVTVAQLCGAMSDTERKRQLIDELLSTMRPTPVVPPRGVGQPTVGAMMALGTICATLGRDSDLLELARWSLPVTTRSIYTALRQLEFDEQRDWALQIGDGLAPYLGCALRTKDPWLIDALLSAWIAIETLGRGRELVLRGILQVKESDRFSEIDSQLRVALSNISHFLLSANAASLDEQWYATLAVLNGERKALERAIGSQITSESIDALNARTGEDILRFGALHPAATCIKLIRSKDVEDEHGRALYAFCGTLDEPWNLIRISPVRTAELMAGQIRADITLTTQRILSTDYHPRQGTYSTEIDAPFTLDSAVGREWASRVLIEPLRRYLSPRRTAIFCPTGDMSMLPIDALFLDGEALLDCADILIVPTLGGLLEQRDSAPHREALLAIHGGGGSIALPPALGVRGSGLAHLPGARIEVEEIAALMGVAPHLPDSITLRRVLDRPVARIIHIAGHSIYADRFERRDRALHGSALGDAFGEGESGSVEDRLFRAALSNPLQTVALAFPATDVDHNDVFVSAARVAQADWSSCHLAVLSGCSTHYGPPTPAGNALTVASAAFAAGADMVIATLWDVDDLVSQQFMSEFYTSLIRHGDVRLAFRAAKVALRSRHPHAVDWASFSLMQCGTDSQITFSAAR